MWQQDALALSALAVGMVSCWFTNDVGGFMCMAVIGGVYASRTVKAEVVVAQSKGLRLELVQANRVDRLRNGGYPTEEGIIRMSKLDEHQRECAEWDRTKQIST